MAAYDFTGPRLLVHTGLKEGASVDLDRAQANYLLNVLRLKAGDEVLVFNGRDGEWQAALSVEGRKAAALLPTRQVREQPVAPDLLYLFAPLKHARLDYMVQKAVEMGAGRLRPVHTRRSQASRVNLDRMAANAVEAAEQCGILSLPEILPDVPLPQALAELGPERLLVFCDEDAPVASPLEALAPWAEPRPMLALLIGPEGGFTDEERRLIATHPQVVRLSLGPRILRADTAAVAALAILQANLGDWS